MSHEHTSGGIMRTVIWVIVFLGIVGIGVGTWLLNSKQKEEIADLESKVETLNSRVENAEQIVVQLSMQDAATPTVKKNAAVGQQGGSEQQTVTKEPEPKTSVPVVKKEQKQSKKKITKRSASGKKARKPVASTKKRSNVVPQTGRWAIYIDAFRTKRHAEITKTLFVMRYPSYVIKRGGWYTVYVGTYKNKIDALADLELLQRDYGPSCRLVKV